MASGDGWAWCRLGHRHWGVHGAAGVLLTAPDPGGRTHVLLQHRAAWSHHGDTWGVPGGARHAGETPEQSALRETSEETGLVTSAVRTLEVHVDDHGGWSYTTVLATASRLLEVHDLDAESTAVRWVPVEDVDQLPLHPGFAESWPLLRDKLSACPGVP